VYIRGFSVVRVLKYPVLSFLAGVSCAPKPAEPQQSSETRSYLMGFSGFPPRPELNAAIAAINMWSQRADAAVFHIEPPWKLMIDGGDIAAYINTEYVGLAQFYRSKSLTIFVTFDATDGLGRDKDARELREAGRSIAEPAIQQLYRTYVTTWVQAIRPDYIGLGAETNLIRLAAPRSVYDGLKAMLNAAAADVRAVAPGVPLYTTVQVDVAWGRLQGTNQYIGVEQDFSDFPFAQVLGLSTYPYLANFGTPAQVPIDYLSRLMNGRTIPSFIAEGGWTSASVTNVQSSTEQQAAYVRRMDELLDHANAFAFLQLNFTDVDTSAFPVPPGYEQILSLFTRIGLVDSELRPKPALAVWDTLFARRKR
jgi:hypothetical protein